jgi:hypothetical protein
VTLTLSPTCSTTWTPATYTTPSSPTTSCDDESPPSQTYTPPSQTYTPPSQTYTPPSNTSPPPSNTTPYLDTSPPSSQTTDCPEESEGLGNPYGGSSTSGWPSNPYNEPSGGPVNYGVSWSTSVWRG